MRALIVLPPMVLARQQAGYDLVIRHITTTEYKAKLVGKTLVEATGTTPTEALENLEVALMKGANG